MINGRSRSSLQEHSRYQDPKVERTGLHSDPRHHGCPESKITNYVKLLFPLAAKLHGRTSEELDIFVWFLIRVDTVYLAKQRHSIPIAFVILIADVVHAVILSLRFWFFVRGYPDAQFIIFISWQKQSMLTKISFIGIWNIFQTKSYTIKLLKTVQLRCFSISRNFIRRLYCNWRRVFSTCKFKSGDRTKMSRPVTCKEMLAAVAGSARSACPKWREWKRSSLARYRSSVRSPRVRSAWVPARSWSQWKRLCSSASAPTVTWL